MTQAVSKVPAADATLRILSFLARQRGPVAATRIRNALGLPRSSTYHLLNVLQEHGYIVHIPDAHQYGLGIAAFELSGGFSRQQPLTLLARRLVEDLVDRVGESGHLAVLHGRDVLYLMEERAPNRPSLVTDVGVRLPAHLTASGRALLAELPAQQLRALYPDRSAFSDRTGVGPQTYSELKRVLTSTRQVGYALEDEEVTPGLASFAIASIDHVGWPVASIALTFRHEDVNPEQEQQILRDLAETAGELTRRLSGRALSAK